MTTPPSADYTPTVQHSNSPEERVLEVLRQGLHDRSLPQGGIILAATPIGNPWDISLRVLAALLSADIIASEDTRRTRALADFFDISLDIPLLSNFDHNEGERAHQLLRHARSGKRVVVLTDAGMPVVSDPGFSILQAACEEGVPVTCLPGPSAVTTAVVLSGLGVGHFTFLGFAPRKEGQRRSWLESLGQRREAVCFFESPHRIAKTLEQALEVLGPDQPIAICRELTKTYEEVYRGTIEGAVLWASNGVRGEIAVVISGSEKKQSHRSLPELIKEVEEKVEEGARLKEVCAILAQREGMSKRDLYQAVLDSRQEE